MGRQRNPNRDIAKKRWLESNGTIKIEQIAKEYGVSKSCIEKWKREDEWNVSFEKQKRKRGGQPGNKNAKGAGAPIGNHNAEKHGIYSTAHLDDLTLEKRDYIESITLDVKENMLRELQLLMAREEDLKDRLYALTGESTDTLYVDKVVEILVPEDDKDDKKLKSNKKELESLIVGRDNLIWDMETKEKAISKQEQKKLDKYEREIAELQDKVNDALQKYDDKDIVLKTNMKTVVKSSLFERIMKLEAELNKIHGRIIKMLDSIRTYELDTCRLNLEEKKYNLARQKATGEFDFNFEDNE